MKICFVTGARSDYERMRHLIRLMYSAPDMEVSIIAMNMHLSPEYGMTVQQIKEDGFPVADQVEMLLSSSTDVGISKTIGVGILGLADVLHRLSPDLVIALGDRFELLAVATVCVCQHIPLAHLCGGEITEGAIDDQVRHMLTKAAHLHFVANRVYMKRILQLGEEEWRICESGSPALDDIKHLKFLSKEELEQELSINLSKKTALVTYHSTTLETLEELRYQVKSLIEALEGYELQYIITYPSADTGSDIIIQHMKEFASRNPDKVRLVRNLGRLRYLSLLKYIVMMIGNSSSGIVEAPSFNVPVVNIGKRQAGRIFGKNVIQSDYSKDAISKAINEALHYKEVACQNPYGDMKASERIVKFIREIFHNYDRNKILKKKFVDRI